MNRYYKRELHLMEWKWVQTLPPDVRLRYNFALDLLMGRA